VPSAIRQRTIRRPWHSIATLMETKPLKFDQLLRESSTEYPGWGDRHVASRLATTSRLTKIGTFVFFIGLVSKERIEDHFLAIRVLEK
jgi:hypothetical protein